MVQVLSPIEKQEKIETLLLTTTSTFGVRKYLTERRILTRKIKKYHSSFGEIRVKYGFLDDKWPEHLGRFNVIYSFDLN